MTAGHTPWLSVEGIVSSCWHVPTAGHVRTHNAAPVHRGGSVGTCWWPGFYYYCHGYYSSPLSRGADQHSEAGSAPLAEPPSAAAAAPSAPLPSDPSGSHGLERSRGQTLLQSLGGQDRAGSPAGRAGRDFLGRWAQGGLGVRTVAPGSSALPGHTEEPPPLALCGLVATLWWGKAWEGWLRGRALSALPSTPSPKQAWEMSKHGMHLGWGRGRVLGVPAQGALGPSCLSTRRECAFSSSWPTGCRHTPSVPVNRRGVFGLGEGLLVKAQGQEKMGMAFS